MDSCPESVTAVTAGGVVGALLFIIGIEFLFILLLWKFRRLVVIIHTNVFVLLVRTC